MQHIDNYIDMLGAKASNWSWDTAHRSCKASANPSSEIIVLWQTTLSCP